MSSGLLLARNLVITVRISLYGSVGAGVLRCYMPAVQNPCPAKLAMSVLLAGRLSCAEPAVHATNGHSATLLLVL